MVWRTTFITISTCFLLGTTFTHWIADHDVLWKRPLTTEAVDTSIKYYSILNSAPKYMLYAYFAMIALTLLSAGGRMIKVFKGGKGEVVFDGGSVVLIAAIVHTQLTETLPNILAFPSPLPKSVHSTLLAHLSSSVRDLATDNIKCAVMLTGVIMLQGGRYYAKRPSKRPVELVDNSGNDSSGEASSPETRPIRPSTPYRELSEAEALDLRN